MVIFEAGSLLCTLAPSSNFFILGRAISGLGRAAINGGNFKLLRQCYPLQKQALVTSLVGAIQSLGLVMGPLIGGLLIDAFSWRACYGMNLPLGVICIGLTAYGFQNPTENPETNLPFREKLKRISFLGTLLAVPSITCLLIALQWGGAKYGWGSWRIILLLVVSVTLFVLFGYLQHRQGEKAMLPPRILKQRSIIAGMWYSACLEGILAVTEYYLSIYFQGIKGYTAAQSGLLTLPMIIGLAVAFVLSGFGITATGHYYREFTWDEWKDDFHRLTVSTAFMFATSILAPIASGLLTTINLEEEIVKVALLLGLLGVAVGMGMQGPSIAMQAALPIKDISIGGAVLGFGSGLGSSMWVCVSATLFQSRLEKEIATYSPSTNVTALQSAGLSGLRDYIGPQKLGKVLAGYDKAVDQTLYIPLALGVLTVIGSLATERRSIKKKRS